MKTDRPLVFVDSSFFKALVDPQDDFNKDAQRIWLSLEREGVALVTTNYILDESFTLIRTRCGTHIVDEFRKSLAHAGKMLKIVRVTIPDEAAAWHWFLADWASLSFTDCVCFAVMQRLGVTRVATFDNHFTRAGFKRER